MKKAASSRAAQPLSLRARLAFGLLFLFLLAMAALLPGPTGNVQGVAIDGVIEKKEIGTVEFRGNVDLVYSLKVRQTTDDLVRIEVPLSIYQQAHEGMSIHKEADQKLPQLGAAPRP